MSALVLAAFGFSAKKFVEIVRDAGTDEDVTTALGRRIVLARRAVGWAALRDEVNLDHANTG